jgi:hypothetical protein
MTTGTGAHCATPDATLPNTRVLIELDLPTKIMAVLFSLAMLQMRSSTSP